VAYQQLSPPRHHSTRKPYLSRPRPHSAAAPRDRILLPRLSRSHRAAPQPPTATARWRPARRVLGSLPRPAHRLLLLSPLTTACSRRSLLPAVLLRRCRRPSSPSPASSRRSPTVPSSSRHPTTHADTRSHRQALAATAMLLDCFC
jgi:hypothetical protein